MNAFILVQKGELTRFGQQEQEILGYLHQWTNGAFWKRLIILDRASFAYTSLVERSIKDKSYWFKSQTTDVEALKQVILDVAQKENWIIRVNARIILKSRISDLDGLKRLPFDAKQTIFCDKIKPGCTPIDSFQCQNRKFQRACHRMPVWEDEAPLNNRQYDINQNDYDVYHEIQGDEVLFWEDLHPDRESKVFFYEQLKILTKYIKEANPKIRTNRDVFKQEVKEWNDLYGRQFISNTTDITFCSTPRAEQLKLLKPKAKCNKWGPWVRNNNCPTCGDGSRQEKRYCYTYNKSRRLSDSYCKVNNDRSTRDIACRNKCKKQWGGWARSNCFGHDSQCHREWWRDCYYYLNGKQMEMTVGCSGSNRKYKNWSGDCGGWGCKSGLKMDDKIWNWFG